MKNRFPVLLLCASLLGACAEDQVALREDVSAPPPVSQTSVGVSENSEDIVMADFEPSVQFLVRHMAKSGVLNTDAKDKNKVLLTRIVNRTQRDFDLACLQKEIQNALRATKKATVITSAKKQNERPDLTLSGRITYRIASVRGKKRTEYYLHLTLADAKTGVNLWENESLVLKNKRKRR